MIYLTANEILSTPLYKPHAKCVISSTSMVIQDLLLFLFRVKLKMHGSLGSTDQKHRTIPGSINWSWILAMDSLVKMDGPNFGLQNAESRREDWRKLDTRASAENSRSNESGRSRRNEEVTLLNSWRSKCTW